MAKNEIQIVLSAPGLETAITALTEAVTAFGKNGAELVIPAGTTAQVTGVQPTPQAQPTAVETPAPQPTPTPAPQPQTVAPVTPQPQAATPQPQATAAATPAPAPAASQAQATQPTAAAPTGPITLDMIVNAGAGLVENGMMDQVIALLGKYGVQAINQAQPEQFDALAADLRALGATI